MPTICNFCAIIKGIRSVEVIYEDALVIAFLEVNAPINFGHTIIVPKDHLSYLSDFNNEIIAHLMLISGRLTKQLQAALKPDGITVMQNNGSFSGIEHYHMHIVPRYSDDNFKWIYPRLDQCISRITEIGDIIRKAS